MDRLKLLLMPLKHQPDFIYLRHVPLRRVHLFTFLQVVCLALLWILKSTVAAIIFPVMVSVVLLHILSQPSPSTHSHTLLWTGKQPLPVKSLVWGSASIQREDCIGSMFPWLPFHESSGGKQAWKVNFFPESCSYFWLFLAAKVRFPMFSPWAA